MYVFKEYPKFLYHKKHQAKIVHSKEEQLALGKEWVESPVLIKNEAVDEKASKSSSKKQEEIIEKTEEVKI